MIMMKMLQSTVYYCFSLFLFRFRFVLLGFIVCVLFTGFFFFFLQESGFGPFGPLRFLRGLVSGSPKVCLLRSFKVSSWCDEGATCWESVNSALCLDSSEGASRLIALWDMKSNGTPAMRRTLSLRLRSC